MNEGAGATCNSIKILPVLLRKVLTTGAAKQQTQRIENHERAQRGGRHDREKMRREFKHEAPTSRETPSSNLQTFMSPLPRRFSEGVVPQ